MIDTSFQFMFAEAALIPELLSMNTPLQVIREPNNVCLYGFQQRAEDPEFQEQCLGEGRQVAGWWLVTVVAY